MHLIVGLGNPGAEYEWSRHNLGFMLIDRLAREAGATVTRRDCRALVGSASIADQRVRLAKPQTFMNLSGEAVGCLMSKLTARGTDSSLLVISDDLALPFGTIRLRARGSAGGHNGLKSIIASLGTGEFMRLRIGIQPEHPLSDAKRYVLDEFPRSQRRELDRLLERAADAVRCILNDGIAKAMSVYNQPAVIGGQ
jgi:peptidyl-tRNA hydrolase, PTH1 family